MRPRWGWCLIRRCQCGLEYINFLQSKNYLEDEIEIVELENLQGVTGLKALRINILYNKNEKDKEYYTYEDLMKELN